MALSAQDMSDMGRLARLAANPQGTTRNELFVAVASLYRVQASHLNARECELMRDILHRLTRGVEMSVRIALAERLADDTTAPHDLILLLASDRIEVARPLILRSPILTDADVLKMIADSDIARQEAVAARAHIGETVTEALARTGAEPVLAALVGNAGARISPATFETLMASSRRLSSLQGPLLRRGDFPPQLAQRMCDWVPDALKRYIAQNYDMAPEVLDEAFDHADSALKSESAPPRNSPAGSAEKLIEKLALSGQLKAGFLMRVLNQGQIDLFDLGFAQLLHLPLAEMRAKFYEGGPRPVALACRAVGIDRCVFPTVFKLSRQARSQRGALTPGDLAEVAALFDGFTKPAALGAFRAC